MVSQHQFELRNILQTTQLHRRSRGFAVAISTNSISSARHTFPHKMAYLTMVIPHFRLAAVTTACANLLANIIIISFVYRYSRNIPKAGGSRGPKMPSRLINPALAWPAVLFPHWKQLLQWQIQCSYFTTNFLPVALSKIQLKMQNA